ncbi:MAG: tetratricopeptide repeat protein [Porticoccaceae bacterium]|nr:tetratricopeptide repeat protein [Porticoccaceae bacterium]
MSFKKINQAVTALQQGDIKLAVSLFDKHRRELKQPQHLHACIMAYYQTNRLDDAEAVLKKLFSRVPSTPQLVSLAADIKKAKGDASGAVVDYRRALKMGPQIPELNYNLALALFELSEITEATSLLKQALLSRPNYVKAKILQGRCLAANEQFDQAQAALAAATDIDPQNYAGHYRLGRLYLHRGNSEKATASLQQALMLNPSLLAAEELLILNSIRAGDRQAAANQVATKLNRMPDNENLIALATDWAVETAAENPFNHYQNAWAKQPRPGLFSGYIKRLIATHNIEHAEILLTDYESRFGHDLPWESAKLALLQSYENYGEMMAFIGSSQNQSAHLEQQCLAQFALGDYGSSFDCAKKLHLGQPRDQYYLALLTTAMRCLGDKRYDELVDYKKLILDANLQSQQDQQQFAGLNQNLINHLNSLHITDTAPLEQSINSGTQTPGNLFSQSQHSSIEQLKISLTKASSTFFESLRTSELNELHPVMANAPAVPFFNASWSIRSTTGSYHSAHVHSKGWYSSACYINVPDVIDDSSDAGYLLFGVPPFKTRDRLDADYKIKPETGKLALFPSYFWHSTKPYSGEGDRLVVAFDAGGPNLFV